MLSNSHSDYKINTFYPVEFVLTAHSVSSYYIFIISFSDARQTTMLLTHRKKVVCSGNMIKAEHAYQNILPKLHL